MLWAQSATQGYTRAKSGETAHTRPHECYPEPVETKYRPVNESCLISVPGINHSDLYRNMRESRWVDYAANSPAAAANELNSPYWTEIAYFVSNSIVSPSSEWQATLLANQHAQRRPTFVFVFCFCFWGLLLQYTQFRMDKTVYSNDSNARLFMVPHLIRH